MEKKIEDAAEKYAIENGFSHKNEAKLKWATDAFNAGALSAAAKEYWQAQFKQTQNNVWVKASERLPDSNFHVNMFCCRYVMIPNEYYNWNVHKIKEMLESSYEIEWLDESCKTISEEEIKALAEKEILYNTQKRAWWVEGFKACLNYKK